MRRASRGGRHGGSWAGFAGFGGGKGTSRSPEAGCGSGREAERGRQPVGAAPFGQPFRRAVERDVADRESVVEGKSVSVRGDLGGHSIITKTTTNTTKHHKGYQQHT